MKLFDRINKERILKMGPEYYYPFYIAYSKVESELMFVRASYRILRDFFHNMKKADLQMFAEGSGEGEISRIC